MDKESETASKRAAASCGFEGFTSTRAQSVNTQVRAARRTKKLRQPHADAIAPPTVGPILGAKPMATPAMPMAVAWRPGGKLTMATVVMNGKRMPVETACRMRPANSTQKPGAARHMSEPARESPRPKSTCCLALKRLEIHVTAGTATPSMSI